MNRGTRLVGKGVLVVSTVLLFGIVFARVFLSSVSNESVRVSWRTLHDSPGLVIICVRDHEGYPVANVAVTSESHSGKAVASGGKAFLTDSVGVAAFKPGERELLALWIGQDRVALAPLGTEFLVPNCASGIVLEATVLR